MQLICRDFENEMRKPEASLLETSHCRFVLLTASNLSELLCKQLLRCDVNHGKETYFTLCAGTAGYSQAKANCQSIYWLRYPSAGAGLGGPTAKAGRIWRCQTSCDWWLYLRWWVMVHKQFFPPCRETRLSFFGLAHKWLPAPTMISGLSWVLFNNNCRLKRTIISKRFAAHFLASTPESPSTAEASLPCKWLGAELKWRCQAGRQNLGPSYSVLSELTGSRSLRFQQGWIQTFRGPKRWEDYGAPYT